MKILQSSFNGDPNIGMYGFATNKSIINGMHGSAIGAIEEHLNVKNVRSIMMSTEFSGIFSTGNDSGIIMSKYIKENGTKIEMSDILEIDTKYTTIGNMILMNNNGIILSPLLKDFKQEIEKFFGLDSDITTISGLNIIGSVGVSNDKGCITHPEIKEDEKKIIEKILGVNLNIGTVSYGSPYVRSGIIANNKAAVVSEISTGHEIGRIIEALEIV